MMRMFSMAKKWVERPPDFHKVPGAIYDLPSKVITSMSIKIYL